MYISMNWISDFVDLDGLDKMKLINKFSLSTAEVENDIYIKGQDISGIVAAEIKEVAPHPDSKKLHLLKVDAGEDELIDVVCAAPNVRVGMKTAFAKVGAQLGDVTISSRKLAGYESCGMCCSEKEIGISDDNSGIMEIFDDVPNGTDLKELYEIDDIIFEVDNKSLTNRPDLWGHYGIAREFAAISGRKLKELDCADLSKYDSLPSVDLKIEDSLCYRYSCIKFENITRNISPVNMRIRLYYCGMRAINYLADLTNYLMLEMGQPMHAFDSRKVGKIRIKRFDKPFEFTTLDNVERHIDEDTLMICNDNTPVAIAGIMGGLDSEIVDDTTSLTLESATFDAVSIRKSTVRLAHRTDASMRYEKALDPEMTITAIARFVYLLAKYDKDIKVISSLTDEYAYKYPTVDLKFDKKYVNRYTGIDIDNEQIVNTLEALGFKVTLSNDEFEVVVPSFRATKDVTIKADIIEEIARIYGYDNFEVKTASAPLYPVCVEVEKDVEDKIKDTLVKRFSLHEVHSYIWENYDDMKELGLQIEPNIRIVNATNPNIETIRNALVPTQLCQIKQNVSFSDDFGIFEIGRAVDGVDENNCCKEEKLLCITLYSKEQHIGQLYYKLRNIIACIAYDIKHRSLSYMPKEANHDYQHPKNLNKIICDDLEIGEIGIIHPNVVNKIDKRASIVYAQINIKDFASIENIGIEYEEDSKYPAIEVDLSFVSDKFEPIEKAIKDENSPLMKKMKLIDIYEDDNNKSITIRLTFSHNERTLTREEVSKVTDRIIDNLKSVGVMLRG